MAFKDRLNGIAFTCSNRRFDTNINKGHPHGVGQASGSVFAQSLVAHGAISLWLEHVTDKQNASDTFWFMWYDHQGSPMIPLSGVFDATDIQEMAKRLADFIDVP
jgi:hypothetical protein